MVTTVAGSGTSGFSDGVGTAAKFTGCNGIFVTSVGNIIVSESDGNRIRQISSTGILALKVGAIPWF